MTNLKRTKKFYKCNYCKRKYHKGLLCYYPSDNKKLDPDTVRLKYDYYCLVCYNTRKYLQIGKNDYDNKTGDRGVCSEEEKNVAQTIYETNRRNVWGKPDIKNSKISWDKLATNIQLQKRSNRNTEPSSSMFISKKNNGSYSTELDK